MANGRIAVLGKIHHALADGVASANLLARGMDPQQRAQADRDSYAVEPAPTKGELVRTAIADHVRHIGRLPGVMRYTAQGVSRVRKSSKKLSPELTRPFTPPPSFMNHRVDAQRKFATATLALADVKETGKHLGVTINDMVLAISAGRCVSCRSSTTATPTTRCWLPSQSVSTSRGSASRAIASPAS